jgi:hypothetical protein
MKLKADSLFRLPKRSRKFLQSYAQCSSGGHVRYIQQEQAQSKGGFGKYDSSAAYKGRLAVGPVACEPFSASSRRSLLAEHFRRILRTSRLALGRFLRQFSSLATASPGRKQPEKENGTAKHQHTKSR